MLRYVLCDVFTDRAFTGNQLAVFTDARGVGAGAMQALAREMNFSESTFVLPPQAGGHARVRIFTPKRELPFAGHPTLGTAFVLGTPMQVDEVRLETGVGVIPVRLEREGAIVTFGWMQQRVPSARALDSADVAELLAALGLAGTAPELPVIEYDNGVQHAFVVVGAREIVAGVAPDLARLARVCKSGVSVVAGSGTRWKTRMFAPAHGVAEDPATGSAAGPLAVHLARHGRIAFGQTIEIEQGVELDRPSQLSAVVRGDRDAIASVAVGGAAVIVGRGEIRAPSGVDAGAS